MKCFKVLSKSLKSNIVENQASVQYKVGKYVKAPKYLSKAKYHLLAFSTLAAAVVFSEADDRIFLAEGKYQTKSLPLRYYWWQVATPAEFLRSSSPGLGWTHGTVMFREIKLIEEIVNED